MPPTQLFQSLTAWAQATERHDTNSAAATAAFGRCCGLLSSLPLQQQSLTPQGLDALCRVLTRDTGKWLAFVHDLATSTQGPALAAAQMAAEEPLIRWAEVTCAGTCTCGHASAWRRSSGGAERASNVDFGGCPAAADAGRTHQLQASVPAGCCSPRRWSQSRGRTIRWMPSASAGPRCTR